jgi:hypothetical protein
MYGGAQRELMLYASWERKHVVRKPTDVWNPHKEEKPRLEVPDE